MEKNNPMNSISRQMQLLGDLAEELKDEIKIQEREKTINELLENGEETPNKKTQQSD
tara:strand:- start:1558 stop:1728 length:171 start_codon:yes stop_codon:yes gene_type:complete